ncbi:MAG: ComEC family competence protein [Marinibacterium sp.]|nr:ComEC family competence protein [Marinibacterium sp.]
MQALARIHRECLDEWLGQRGHLLPWAPVCLGLGIGGYFSLPVEPGGGLYAALAALGLITFVWAWVRPGIWSPLGYGLALVAAGACLAGARAHRIAAPVLDFRYYGPVEGRVVAMDRSASDALRLTLDRVILARTSPDRLPGRVRVSLHGDAVGAAVLPGARVMTTAHLSPPQGPVEPGGFDFRRHAWFQQLGGVGYTRVPVLTVAPPEGAALRIFRLRMAVSQAMRAALPGDVGGFAAAVTTGDRSGVSQGALDDLRASNLAHLLAISGLHMGLLAGFVFGVLRYGLALIPVLALRLPVRKIAAAVALVVAAGYLALSGGNIATERAFVMVAVALLAVICDRRALSLRAVAIAALIVLMLRPEALLSPGFQMSFAATTALVAVFGWMRDGAVSLGPAWIAPVLGVVMSSAVAGAATAPVGAAHFNAMAKYGLLANLLSVPVMGVLVIPAAVLALCLVPLGLQGVGLWLMGQGLRWILGVAHRVADLPQAQGFVPSPDAVVLPLIALGALWGILWQGRLRWLGLAPLGAAIVLWAQVERPPVLIADTGGLVGVMTDAGRALSKPRGAGFVAGVWLENDGDGADQAGAASRWPRDDGPPHLPALGREVVHITGKRAAKGFTRCTKGQIVVSAVEIAPTGPCRIYGPDTLRISGALALYPDRIVSARDLAGQRLWTPRD